MDPMGYVICFKFLTPKKTQPSVVVSQIGLKNIDHIPHPTSAKARRKAPNRSDTPSDCPASSA